MQPGSTDFVTAYWSNCDKPAVQTPRLSEPGASNRCCRAEPHALLVLLEYSSLPARLSAARLDNSWRSHRELSAYGCWTSGSGS